MMATMDGKQMERKRETQIFCEKRVCNNRQEQSLVFIVNETAG